MTGAIRVAVVGSGPSGFYAAGHLFRQSEFDVTVDMFDRLPTPFGLVRAGVAPDHPKIKSVTRMFDKTAQHPGYRFFGNVEIGVDISARELTQSYEAIIYASGADRGKRVGIPGDRLAGNHSATEFVGWYNGHPDYRDARFDLSAARAVIIGNGNVALDVARMLALPVTQLAGTDIADHALTALAESRIEEIVVLGRRGPVQAAFTHPELLELGELPDVDVVVAAKDLGGIGDIADASMTTRKNTDTLREFSLRTPQGKKRRIVLRFFSSPVEIVGEGNVAGVKIARTELTSAGSLRTTADLEDVSAGLVIHAVGYTGTPLTGVPFEPQRGVIANEGGRVVNEYGPIAGCYVTGWIKRGPSGVIGTNKLCAQETVDALLDDLRHARLLPKDTLDADAMRNRITDRVPDVVDFDGWVAIDAHERRLGQQQNRPRVKITHRPRLVAIGTGADRAC